MIKQSYSTPECEFAATPKNCICAGSGESFDSTLIEEFGSAEGDWD